MVCFPCSFRLQGRTAKFRPCLLEAAKFDMNGNYGQSSYNRAVCGDSLRALLSPLEALARNQATRCCTLNSQKGHGGIVFALSRAPIGSALWSGDFGCISCCTGFFQGQRGRPAASIQQHHPPGLHPAHRLAPSRVCNQHIDSQIWKPLTRRTLCQARVACRSQADRSCWPLSRSVRDLRG